MMGIRAKDKVALISGGSRGQGAAEARLLAAEGAMVVIGDLRCDTGRAVAAEIGDACQFVELDVTDVASWDAAIATTSSAFGGLDVLVNNAGIAGFTPIVDGDVDEYKKVIDVNQLGVYLGMRAAAPAMKMRGGGSIINISSIDGLIGMPYVSAYVASKFAVRGMTKVAALELARHGIRVNSVHPGFIDTLMVREPMGDELADSLAKSVPLRRLGTSDEIAELVVYLASDGSAYCTGSEFVIDGGVTAGLATPGMG
jgi:3alpha(or 20beta)-hydroxysteroid dehydrogenase